MTASSSLRQRRHRRDDEENANNNNADNSINEEDEMELFAKHYKQATTNNSSSQCQTILLILIGIIILAITFIILQHTSSQQTLNNSNAIQRQDLKLITIYPQNITSQIHKLKSQTELLITETNKEAINAIRIGIGMSNNLHYHHNTAKSYNGNSRIRKRKKKGVAGILLGISNFITTLRSSSSSSSSSVNDVEEEEGYIPGDIVLEPYDEIMIRNYLVEFGGRCSSNHSDHVNDNDENTILNRYDEISTLIQTTDDTDMHNDILWNHIIQLFTLCQFTNNDARGYIAFNTTLSKSIGKDTVSIQERLEESRMNGVGMIVKQSDDDNHALHVIEDGDDSLQYASLFVIPSEEAARNKARKMLYKRLEDKIPSLTTTTSRQPPKSSLLLEITEVSERDRTERK